MIQGEMNLVNMMQITMHFLVPGNHTTQGSLAATFSSLLYRRFVRRQA